MRNKSTRQKGKQTLTSQYKSFEQRLESLEDKKAAHVQTWCQKDLFFFFAKRDRLAKSLDVNPLETIWIIVDEKTYKEPVPK